MSVDERDSGQRRRRRGRTREALRQLRTQGAGSRTPAIGPGLIGGSYRPLSDADLDKIHDASLEILERFGVKDPIEPWRDRVVAAGGWMTDNGRLCFPRAMVEDVLSRAGRDVTLYGREEKHDLLLSGSRTYVATATAAIRLLDPDSGDFRDTTLKDLYDMVRMADALDNVHFVQRPCIARDLADDDELDINTAYATMTATSKHIITTFFQPASLEKAVELYDLSIGGSGSGDAFRQRPFASTTCAIVVSPLRFSPDSCWVAEKAVQLGVPVKVSTVSQAGATGPVTLAGNVTLGNAEVLAGFVALNLLAPGHPLLMANWPFVSDLRTGAFAGGGGEMALLMSASAQLGRYYDLPTTVASGMTSAKVPDAQSGWEKGYLVTTAALSGANMVMMTMGGLADNVAYSPEALIIDESMLSGVLRTVRGIEVDDKTLAIDSIEHAINGAGHFLSDDLTLEMMESEFVYPQLADRLSIDEWKEQGANDVRERARANMFAILDEHYPQHLSPQDDARIRQRFDIKLDRAVMSMPPK